MSPAAAFHAQLASIMEVLANTAVAEICELVDSGYSVLQLEISRSRKENEQLRRKLRLMELRTARATALRAAAIGGALPLAGSRARALPPAHHPGNEPRSSGTCRGESTQETLQCPDQDLCSDSGPDAALTPAADDSDKPSTATIKVEEDGEDGSWSRSEPDNDFGSVVDVQAPPPLTKQEVADTDGGSSGSWVSGEVSSTSMLVHPPPTSRTSETGSYQPQIQHGALTTQNPLGEDPGCSYVLNAGASDSDSFPFATGDVTQSTELQQRALLPPDEPQLPARKEAAAERQGAVFRRDRWRLPGHGGGKKFVCNFCGKSLACLKNLKTHMRVHTGEKPFVCALCGKCFSDSSNLKRHQSVHTGEKRYGCVHCGKRFAQSGSLKVHMTVHSDCKQFSCSLCGKTFISGSHLRRHVTVHAAEKRFAPALLQ